MIISRLLLVLIILLVLLYQYKPSIPECIIMITGTTLSLCITYLNRDIDLYLLECFYILMFFFLLKTDPAERKEKLPTPLYHVVLGIFSAISMVVNLLYILISQ